MRSNEFADGMLGKKRFSNISIFSEQHTTLATVIQRVESLYGGSLEVDL